MNFVRENIVHNAKVSRINIVACCFIPRENREVFISFMGDSN